MYHPKRVENQWVSMDMIQSQDRVELNTAKKTKNKAPRRYILKCKSVPPTSSSAKLHLRNMRAKIKKVAM